MDIAKRILKEPEIRTSQQYRHRVIALTWVFSLMFLVSLIAVILLIRWTKHLVLLAQRSNVETLTIAFFLVFFVYLAFVSSRGAWGSLQILWFAILRVIAKDPISVERRLERWLGQRRDEPSTAVALNLVVEREEFPHEPFEIQIEDVSGSMGAIRVDGARVEHISTYRDGSNSLFVYFTEQLMDILGKRGLPCNIDVVEWMKLDDEETEKYLCLVKFATNLERQLNCQELWPKVRISQKDCEELQRRLSELCPTLRREALLPHWEYAGDHKLPIIPEPLGIIGLSRSEKRVDPLTSMGASLVTVLVSFCILVYIVLYPPWVPGK